MKLSKTVLKEGKTDKWLKYVCDISWKLIRKAELLLVRCDGIMSRGRICIYRKKR